MIFLLDYDGTIVPIAPAPDAAVIDDKTKNLIENLLRKHKVAIVTGRDYDSFRKVFGKVPENLFVVASHGYEIYRDETLIHKEMEVYKPPLEDLEKKISNMDGVFLEKKRGGFALHYRLFGGKEGEVKKIFSEFIKKHPPRKIIEGKKVLEGVYSEADKGKGIERLFKITGWNPKDAVYIGDDTTDFDAFRVIKNLGGKAYYVGANIPPVNIDHRLKDVEEVIELLESFT